MEFDRLAEDCISKILSFTTPLDACRSSSVSSSFQSASVSDLVWESFLPSDYLHILSTSLTPLQFSSKKQLFLLLCHPISTDHGRKSFKLEKSSGKKSYFLSATDLNITRSNDPMYWTWVSLPQSRFAEVATLRTICWVEIEGEIRAKVLSPNTLYGAYLVLKISNGAYGLDLIPWEVSIQVGNQFFNSTAHLQHLKKHKIQQLMYANRTEMLNSRVVMNVGEKSRTPIEREDGWLEIEIGDFFINAGNGDDEKVIMKFKEVKGHHLKGGLVIEGIEIRPKIKI